MSRLSVSYAPWFLRARRALGLLALVALTGGLAVEPAWSQWQLPISTRTSMDLAPFPGGFNAARMAGDSQRRSAAGDWAYDYQPPDDEASPSDRLRPGQRPPVADDPADPPPPTPESAGGESLFFEPGCGCMAALVESYQFGSQVVTRGCECGRAICEPRRLLGIANDRTEFGGWLASGLTLADHNVASTAPVAFPNPTDEALVNQLWGYAYRDPRGGCGLDWGFRIDYVFGADGPDTQATGDRGWDFGWNTGGTGGNTYGSAIPQLYVAVGDRDWSVKAGRFLTPIGYESVPVVNNPFYSHSYLMNYGEPFTHTGVLAEYDWNRYVTLFAGYTFGWDSGFENLLDAHTFLGGAKLQASERVQLAYLTNFGEFGDGTRADFTVGNAGEIALHSLVTTVDLACRWRYIAQADWGLNYGFDSPNNEWYGLSQYLLYQFDRDWRAGLRFEAFRDQAGTTGRIQAVAETYQAWTLGLTWTPHRNLMLRPEVRWDYVNNGTQPFGGNNSLFTAAIDAVVRF